MEDDFQAIADNKETAFGVSLSMAEELAPKNRHALVIGIDLYPFVNANPLRGCVNDAERMAALLEDLFGFQVRLLLDGEATRGKVLGALEKILDEVRPDDRVVVHFSGHGSQVVESDGRRVETFVPQDSGRGSYANRDISDRELRGWLGEIWRVTPYVTLVFDSCHAGGIVRELEAPARGVEADFRPGCLAGKTAFGAGLSGDAFRDPSSWGQRPLSERYTLIAACRAGERAREIEDPVTGRRHGILTCYLSEELARLRRRSTYREVFDQVALRVRGRFREQNPQLEGAWDREVFESSDLHPMRFVPVVSRDGSEVILGGGAVHDVVPGSEWHVYPLGTRRTTDTEPVGSLCVTGAETGRAAAHLLDEACAGAVREGSRAVEIGRPQIYRRLAIRLPEDTVDDLAPQVDASPLLVACKDAADVAVRFSEDCWLVTDYSGRLILPLQFQVENVVRGLERLARRRALAELRHPHPEHVLKDVLTIELYRRRPGDDWGPAQPEAGGSICYLEGDYLGLRVRHAFERSLYLVVLDLGLAGSIELLHPTRGAVESLPPSLDLDIGFAEDDAMELFVPAELPAPGDGLEGGLETLVFIATTDPLDLDLFARESPLGPEGSTALESFLRQALQGEPESSRDTRKLRLHSPRDAWTAASRSFLLGRPR